MENSFDVVIIGSGLGGLECGLTLSKEGYNVCVVEQSALFGGCLQSFKRNGRVVDTGIHYIGSMDEGEIMHQYFKYYGILDELNYIKLDHDFDQIHFGHEGSFNYQTGFSNFRESLIDHFPHQRGGIERYCEKLSKIGESISVDIHRSGRFSTGDIEPLSISASGFIDECVSDQRLQNILAGTNALYGGMREQSNLYHHSMVNYSNMQGACRFVGGTQHVADSFVNHIRANGGVVRNRSRVISIDMGTEGATSVTLEGGERIFGRYFISDIHPDHTFDLVEQTPLVKRAYRSRLKLLPNTYSLFSVYLLMKRDSFPYINSNQYYYQREDAWDTMLDSESLRPKSVLMSSQLSHQESVYSDVITLMTPVEYPLFERWRGLPIMQRGEEYEALKGELNQNIINFVAQFQPDLKSCIDKVYSASPLTYESYTSTPKGSAYGLLKDYRNAFVSLLPAKTRVPNLLLTGQNLNVHGALGVTLTSAITCSELLGVEYLAREIGNS
ncbi:MAG: NAD(P)/FAD-dependent oxidoreductase [Rikenellaceae bacterium]